MRIHASAPLPPGAISVHVGVAQTAARYYLANHGAVRRMLRELSENPRTKTGEYYLAK